jgi:hypothetical protein
MMPMPCAAPCPRPRRLRASCLALVGALGLLAPAGARAAGEASRPGAAMRRFALIASSNDGGPGRDRLRFADSDARAMADVLAQLGGLARADLVLLTEARPASLRASFQRLRDIVAAAPRGPARNEVLIYYSGHSDEQGLLLGGQRLEYMELRQLIDQTGADVRIAILDSCASEALIRVRGGARRPSFLSDVSSDARGYAFLTASSADEAAQESDRIGAAFFTHYLVSGLRGGADSNRDGLITLAEGYQFAYHETLRRTERTAAGAQHPAFDFQLAGKGLGVVLTDLRATSASLVLAEELAGRVYVRDQDGRLLVELLKQPPFPVQLGLAPGQYRVLLEQGGQAREAAVALRDGESRRLDGSEFTSVQLQVAVVRGGGAPGSAPPVATPPAPSAPPSLASRIVGPDSLVGRTHSIGGYAGLSPRYTRLGARDAFVMNLEAALLFDHRFSVGLTAGGGISGNIDDEGNRLAIGYAGLAARYDFLCEGSAFCFSVGGMVGAGGIDLDSSDAENPDRKQGRGDALFIFEPQLSGHLNVTRFLRLGVDAGYRLVAGAEAFAWSDLAGPTAGAHLQLGWF